MKRTASAGTAEASHRLEEAEAMAKHTVVTMPGDGIGEVVLPEAVRVLEHVGFDAEYVHADIGWEFWINEGNPLPERTIEMHAPFVIPILRLSSLLRCRHF